MNIYMVDSCECTEEVAVHITSIPRIVFMNKIYILETLALICSSGKTVKKIYVLIISYYNTKDTLSYSQFLQLLGRIRDQGLISFKTKRKNQDPAKSAVSITSAGMKYFINEYDRIRKDEGADVLERLLITKYRSLSLSESFKSQ